MKAPQNFGHEVSRYDDAALVDAHGPALDVVVMLGAPATEQADHADGRAVTTAVQIRRWLRAGMGTSSRAQCARLRGG